MIVLDVIFRSASGKSILDKKPSEKANELSQYSTTKETQEEAVRLLVGMGFKLVGPASQFGTSIIGSHKLVKDIFGDEPFCIPESMSMVIEAVGLPPEVEYYKKARARLRLT